MTSLQPDHLLARGIAAARKGRRAEARRLLEQVVEADPALSEAWWWLSRLVDDETQRLTCLENVLTLDPDHAEARARLREMRGAAIPTSAPGRPTSNQNYAPASPLDPFDPTLDDPYQCVYCGRPTQPNDETCPHCHRSLVTHQRTARQRTRTLATLLLVLVILACWNGLGAVGLMVRITRGDVPPDMVQSLTEAGSLNPVRQPTTSLLWNPFVKFLIGDLLAMDYTLARRLFLVSVVRIALLVALGFVLYWRWTPAFYAALAALLIGLVWDLFRAVNAYTGWPLAMVSIALGAGSLLLLVRSEGNFALTSVRMQTRLHPAATGGPGGYYWGMRYTREGKHALAALHFRKAVGRAPMEAEYYKRLALSYAQIDRHERSLRELKQAHALRPDDPEITQIEALVRQMQRRATSEKQ